MSEIGAMTRSERELLFYWKVPHDDDFLCFLTPVATYFMEIIIDLMPNSVYDHDTRQRARFSSRLSTYLCVSSYLGYFERLLKYSNAINESYHVD